MILFDTAGITADLARDEGRSLVVYDDATGRPVKPGSQLVGHPTIGTGRALDVHGISADEAACLLQNDLLACLSDLSSLAWWKALDPVRQRAIVNMRFQLGLGGLLAFRDMIAALERGDYAGAAAAARDSHWARQTTVRAARVADMIETGIVPTSSNAG